MLHESKHNSMNLGCGPSVVLMNARPRCNLLNKGRHSFNLFHGLSAFRRNSSKLSHVQHLAASTYKIGRNYFSLAIYDDKLKQIAWDSWEARVYGSVCFWVFFKFSFTFLSVRHSSFIFACTFTGDGSCVPLRLQSRLHAEHVVNAIHDWLFTDGQQLELWCETWRTTAVNDYNFPCWGTNHEESCSSVLQLRLPQSWRQFR